MWPIWLAAAWARCSSISIAAAAIRIDGAFANPCYTVWPRSRELRAHVLEISLSKNGYTRYFIGQSCIAHWTGLCIPASVLRVNSMYMPETVDLTPSQTSRTTGGSN
ncbi:hypothetical protein FDECE_14809 [Fusarium decemcellulare]|nr:hypothetical protein FDECE_14809 [Fusarium decemcellulare]